MSRAPWYRDPSARSFIGLCFLPWLAVLSLAWEAAQLPLYTLWREATPTYIAFAVLHCTLGDILIGTAALMLALIAGREGALAHWRWGQLAVLTVFFSATYTIFSEWMNVTILRSWAYDASMPRIGLGGFEIGLSPLAQWLVVPPLALHFAKTIRSLP